MDRLLSAYEFAVDIAAKGVLSLEVPKKNPKRKSDFVGTLEVWPWSVLIPWFKRDMRERVRPGARLPLATPNSTAVGKHGCSAGWPGCGACD